MPTRKETASLVQRLFEGAKYPAELTPETAWLGIYQVLLWYEDTGQGELLPHIISADNLRPTRGGARKPGNKWVARARAVTEFLAEQLGCAPADVPRHVDSLMRNENYRDLQRQNPLGIAFAELVAHVLRRFGALGVVYETEVPAERLFPGVKLQSRSKRPRIDVVALREGTPLALISTKWSVRHDRLVDVIDESFSYRAAAMRRGLDMPCVFVTNEYSPARLDKILSAGVLRSVVHVCPTILTDVCGLDGRLHELKALPYLVGETHKW